METYKAQPRQPQRRLKKSPTLKYLLWGATGGATVMLFAFLGYFFYLLGALPKVDRLADYRPPILSQVYGQDGTLVGEFYLERRTVVPVDKMPKRLIQAFVSAEDSNFYQHKGIDYLGIARAAVKNLISMRKKEGASTITQQVAKSMLLTPEKKFSRKLKEAILAKRMEERLTKDEILYIYLNQIYLGAGAYGVQLAAETYFGKEVDKLNLAEMAMLAGLPKAPNSYSPIKHLERAKERQGYVLERMVKEGYITQAEAEYAKATPIVIQPLKKVNAEQSAYFLEQVRQQLVEKYGEERLYKDGLKIYTTMNAEMQRGAYDSVVNGLKAVDKRQGFRGAARYLAETEVEPFCKKVEDDIDELSLKQGAVYQGVVTGVDPAKRELTVRVGDRTGTLPKKNMEWAGKVELVNSYGKPQAKRAIGLGAVLELQVKEPDKNRAGAVFALDQVPEAQAALIAIDPMTGGVRAMVGGYDYKKSQFNRAMQAKRNPGSAFKPVIYAAALEHGMTTASIIDDSQVEYESGGDKAWKPKNYDNVYRGPVTMREALTNSINVVSVKILEKIGVGTAIDYAKKLGITSPLASNLTLALGSSSVTPMELTSAYAVFASGGYRTTPYFVTKVLDRDGNVLEEVQEPKVPVFGKMSSAAADAPAEGDGEEGAAPPAVPQPGQPVLSEASGGVVPVIPPETAFIMTNLMESVVSSGTGGRARALGRPVAGKTGTTNDMKDAWFVGYVPQLVAGVWVGYDQERSLGSGGSGGQAAAPIWTEFMQRALAGVPVKSFPTPGNVTFALIDPRNGHLAKEGTPGAVQECFVSGTEPTSYGSDPAPEAASTP
ncbi:penicillin-binding protein 1A [Geomonas subterranea]|uniref:Penicillin-binding protein 1A n=1 Tax=Geomonas subterranea TaxID=2847989 RepID=A0ABX8LDU4_9BACT|nr:MULTISPECIES: PBP1A family penicillin-binding protein [Geomonas]QXE89837.1 PBP1A family penicillin-binding protein [Geomonas subterranea]QXM08045.1 PBP1A family penicillin-binding protein [Geomonas subterranea]